MSKTKRWGALISAAVLTAVMLLAGTPASAAKTQKELEAEQEQLLAEAAKWAKKYKNTEATIDEKEKYQRSLQRQIDNIEAQISLLNSQINKTQKELDGKDAELAAKEAEITEREAAISAQFDALCARLRAISKSGNMSALQMLMSTESYTDYLYKSKIMERIAEKDRALMDELEQEIADIHAQMDVVKEERAVFEAKKAELDGLKAEQVKKENAVDKLYEEVQKVIRDLESDSAYYRAKQKAYEKEAAKIDEQIAAMTGTSSGKYSGSMVWPVPGYYTITSYYGSRWGTIHRGIDISGGGIRGAKIYAAADGTVKYINRTDSWGGTYGYHVILDNGLNDKGQAISTVYAHMESVASGLTVGQKVVKGKTVLGYVGTTGNSTGYHLHFEVRVNGQHTNPIPTYVNPNK